ncbi:hypothetical protein [Planctomicrobium piriforme]|nr:hypothetical protein [Planctomicrobium piriforme]
MIDTTTTQFAVCVNNSSFPASLETRKIYQLLTDVDAEQQHLLRVIDESGEDYLYPAECFVLIDLPHKLKSALLKAA